MLLVKLIFFKRTCEEIIYLFQGLLAIKTKKKKTKIYIEIQIICSISLKNFKRNIG